MAPCNCGGGSNQQQQYVFVSPTGQQVTYKSEVEARAAQIRSGGGTYTAVPVR